MSRNKKEKKSLVPIFIVFAFLIFAGILLYGGMHGWFRSQQMTIVNQTTESQLNNPTNYDKCGITFNKYTACVDEEVTITVKDGASGQCAVYYKYNNGAWTFLSLVNLNTGGIFTAQRSTAVAGQYTFAAICSSDAYSCVTQPTTINIVFCGDDDGEDEVGEEEGIDCDHIQNPTSQADCNIGICYAGEGDCTFKVDAIYGPRCTCSTGDEDQEPEDPYNGCYCEDTTPTFPNGLNYFLTGKCHSATGFTYGETCMLDADEDIYYLSESYCEEDGDCNFDWHLCFPNVCTNGACYSVSGTSDCFDTDGGDYPRSPGVVYQSFYPHGELYDWCDGNRLNEQTCGSTKYYDCTTYCAGCTCRTIANDRFPGLGYCGTS